MQYKSTKSTNDLLVHKDRENSNPQTNGLFGWKGEGGGVKENRVVLTKNKLILC